MISEVLAGESLAVIELVVNAEEFFHLVQKLEGLYRLLTRREVVQELSGQINNWLNMKPVDNKSYQEDIKALWKTLEIMEHLEFLFKKNDEKAGDKAA